MAMGKQPISTNVALAALCLLAPLALAVEVSVSSSVGAGLVFTDNVDQTASDRQGSLITTANADFGLDVSGVDGNVLLLNYGLSQLFYSHDGNDNALYQTLQFEADKGIGNGFRVDAIASIENIAAAIDENANADIFSGDTVESRQAEIGLSYQSNPLSDSNLSARIFGIVINNEDDIGNYDGIGASLSFSNGPNVRDMFWLIEGTYDYKQSQGDDPNTSFVILREEIGFQTMYRWVPFVRLNYENYSGLTDADSDDMLSWGPAVRYFWTKTTYFELSYNFTETENQSDFWAGAIYLRPSPRTLLRASYDKRTFGDAYFFLLSHRSRRLTNEITYEEEVTNFDRDTFVSGANIAEATLERRLTWLSTLEARRSTFIFSLYRFEVDALNATNNDGDESGYGASIAADHRLSRRFSVSALIDYSDYHFKNLDTPDQDDHYWTFSIDGSYTINPEVVLTAGVEHNTRSSSLPDDGYDENRIYLELSVDL
ncbi:TIGR03016 family PEP-CTERM system-associated outer membrane protein [Photobacterium japonica]|uniref:TIGR03016 family PEP-CTERM system-associated outer membrane protein n=1 Tax=Photobacterium japonica TaxID=2910235 RepID=UPI003D0BABF2